MEIKIRRGKWKEERRAFPATFHHEEDYEVCDGGKEVCL
jgi:hypothetical protein